MIWMESAGEEIDCNDRIITRNREGRRKRVRSEGPYEG
jgi:hypothetical protein